MCGSVGRSVLAAAAAFSETAPWVGGNCSDELADALAANGWTVPLPAGVFGPTPLSVAASSAGRSVGLRRRRRRLSFTASWVGGSWPQVSPGALATSGWTHGGISHTDQSSQFSPIFDRRQHTVAVGHVLPLIH